MTNDEITTAQALAWFERLSTPMPGARAMFNKAIAALRVQIEVEQGCDKCSGIVYRQTASGKVIPTEQKCGVKITPPCYQADGDGCAYQVYGDNNDEPIERCKECPLCYSDKVRHHEVMMNEPLKLDELREINDGEIVWVCYPQHISSDSEGIWCSRYEFNFHNYGKTWLAYRHNPKEDKQNDKE